MSWPKHEILQLTFFLDVDSVTDICKLYDVDQLIEVKFIPARKKSARINRPKHTPSHWIEVSPDDGDGSQVIMTSARRWFWPAPGWTRRSTDRGK